MEYVVYCDESRHDEGPRHSFMSIGGIWLPRERKKEVSREFRKLCVSLGLRSEVKWSKVSSLYLDAYKRLVDFFFDEDELRFRAIIVEHSKVNFPMYHEGDEELGFYKFYYQMLNKWMFRDHQYLILLDFKQNKEATRYKDLRKVLENTLGVGSLINLYVIDSAQSPLAQLCDLLTGAVAASWCDDTSGPKKELATYIASKTGWASLRVESSSPALSKINLFRIRLD